MVQLELKRRWWERRALLRGSRHELGNWGCHIRIEYFCQRCFGGTVCKVGLVVDKAKFISKGILERTVCLGVAIAVWATIP